MGKIEEIKKIEKLKTFFEGLKYDDFHNGKLKRLEGGVELGDQFITDYIGNDLSLCKRVRFYISRADFGKRKLRYS